MLTRPDESLAPPPPKPGETPLGRLRRLALADGGLPIVWLTLTIVMLLPIWGQRLVPFQDAPNHMALIRAWHNFHDPAYRIAEFYDLRVRLVPYFLHYSVVHLLMYVFPIEVANKLFVSGYLVGFPLSVLAFARAIKRSPWLALGAFGLAFNICYAYGFWSYSAGSCFMFLSWALLIRWLDGGRKLLLLWLGISTTLAYLGHVMPWFVLGLGCGAILLLWVRRDWKRTLLAIPPLLPSVGLAVAAMIEERNARAYMKHRGAFNATWYDGWFLLKRLYHWTIDICPDNFGVWVLAVIAATVIGLWAWRGARIDGTFGQVHDRLLTRLIVILALMYVLLPHQVKQPMAWWFITERIPGMMMPLFLLLPAARLDGWKRLVVLPMVLACLLFPLHLWRHYRVFNARYQPFIRLVDKIPVGATTYVVSRPRSWFTEIPADDVTIVTVDEHATSWPMALKGGYSPFLFDQGIPVRPRVRLRAPPYRSPIPFTLDQAPEFDYLLIQNAPREIATIPVLEQVGALGNWVLLKHRRDITDEP